MSSKTRKLVLPSPDVSDAEPVAKRTRSARWKKEETLKLDMVASEPNILDILNEDCWRMVLDYVSIRDVARSERVCKQWRGVVLRYLARARLYVRTCIYDHYKSAIPSVKCRILGVYEKYYVKVIAKYGTAIVASDCMHEAGLRALGRYTPDLEELRLRNEQYHNLQHKAVKLNKLRRLYLDGVIRFKDAHVSKMLGSTTLQQLKIVKNQMMTGTCLNDLQSNLKSLQLSRCQRLEITHLLAASHNLTDLTKLELNVNSKYVLQNVYKLLNRTPNLEYLGLECYESTEVGGLVEALRELTRLKHLGLNSNQSARDSWLQAVGQNCKKLRTLDVGGCKGVTAAGIEALCRAAGETLVGLRLSHSCLKAGDMLRWVVLCPNLEMFDLHWGRLVSHGLSASIAALGPRRRPLRLRSGSAPTEPARRYICKHHTGFQPRAIPMPLLLNNYLNI